MSWNDDCKVEILYTQTRSTDKPGGQHAGNPSTYVKITHMPTDISAECGFYQSSFKNKHIALLMLEFALVEMKII